MLKLLNFEILPDEIILLICQYLRSADIFYSLYNLNSRLNITISGYCRYVNLMSVSYQQFQYSVRYVLPQIGSLVRTFLLNGNWETIINKNLSLTIFGPNLSLLFPNLEILTIKWFTTTKFLAFLKVLKNFSCLNQLNIRCLKGKSMDLIELNLLSANDNRLDMISIDHDSSDFDISETDSSISYPNIQQLTINLIGHELIVRLFHLVPNVRCLHINTDELLDTKDPKSTINNLPILIHLIDFKIRSINLFWTFEEMKILLQSMPNLQQLSLDIRTNDQEFVDHEQLQTILPSSLNKLDFFIRFYYSKSKYPDPTSIHFSSTRFPMISMLDKPRRRFLIHTIPYNQRSAILTETISNQMPNGWFYTQRIQNLYLYDVTSVTDVLLVLQHFRQLRMLSIDIKDKSNVGKTLLFLSNFNRLKSVFCLVTQSADLKPIELNLPYLKQIDVTGIIELTPILINAPSVDYLIIGFECMKLLLDNNYQLITKRIVRLNVLNWIDMNSDLLVRVHASFSSLRHLVIMMKESTVVIDDFLLRILSLWNRKPRISIDVKGVLSEKIQENLRQWTVEHASIQEDYLFEVEYSDNWFDLWL